MNEKDIYKKTPLINRIKGKEQKTARDYMPQELSM